VFVLTHYYLLCTESNDRRVNGEDVSEWRDASLSISQNPPLLPASERGAALRLKSPGPSISLSFSFGPRPAPRSGPLSCLHFLPVCRRGPRPRVSVCGQCTLLHEPRPFTEGPRNATALNNHPLEDRRPCAAGRKRRKRRKASLAYEFGGLRAGKMRGFAIMDNEWLQPSESSLARAEIGRLDPNNFSLSFSLSLSIYMYLSMSISLSLSFSLSDRLFAKLDPPRRETRSRKSRALLRSVLPRVSERERERGRRREMGD